MKVIITFIIIGVLGLVAFYSIGFDLDKCDQKEKQAGILHERTSPEPFYMKNRHAQNASITVRQSLFILANPAKITIPEEGEHSADDIASWYNELLGKCKANVKVDGINLSFGHLDLSITAEEAAKQQTSTININTKSIVIASEAIVSLGAERISNRPNYFKDPFGNTIRLIDIPE